MDPIEDLSPAALDAFDDIIDVRSPSEFADDHVPGAINLPVLDDAQRAEVGTIYVQQSAFLARRIGAAYVSRNISRALETTLSDRPPGYRPLVYCWRGGMRSRAMALVLSSIGWRVGVVRDGYKCWRREVTTGLHADEASLPVILIDGQTGTAKTRILDALAGLGAQVIDLEGRAVHRGSAFGAFADRPQPPQKRFESGLWDAVRRFDLSRPIYLEAESNRVGRLRVPARLWRAMKSAPRIVVSAPLEARAGHILATYPDVTASRAAILAAIDQLQPMHARNVIEDWRALAAAGEDAALVRDLISRHYDPLYSRSRLRGAAGSVIAELSLPGLSDTDIKIAAERVLSIRPKAGHSPARMIR
ncbi:tRNA 2-selenouridine(34) synthase MnmH [bacterium]|nr:tRNA 2-selenouridine(34) synthase MnmH [bacterium]